MAAVAQEPLPPQNLEAEESVLGAMMLSPGAVDACLSVLEPEGERKFYRQETHGGIYRVCRALHLAGQPCDAIALAAALEEQGSLGQVGGKSRIHELAALVPAVSNAGHYARIVRDNWARRGIIRALREAEKAAFQGDAANALEEAERGLLDVRSAIERGASRSYATMLELAEQLDERVKNPPGADDGIPAPFAFLPHLKGGRLYVLAGYTADGKTVAAVQFAKAAAKRGLRVGFFSIEMSKEQLFDRLIASFGVPLHEVESGRISQPRREAYARAVQEVVGWQVEVIDDPEANAVSLRRFQRLRRYDLLIVDHLHQIVLDGPASARRQLLEDEVHAITTLARGENVPVLLLAQLSRVSGGAPYPRPTLSMLRETARIEQQAWMVSFIWRHRDERQQPTDDAELIIAKNRSGPLGWRPLAFNGPQVHYVEKEAE